MYLLYEKWLDIKNKTDSDIYELNICVSYIQENVNKIINILNNIKYVPFKKWFL